MEDCIRVFICRECLSMDACLRDMTWEGRKDKVRE